MALHHYFKKLPDPNGPLSSTMAPEIIKAADKIVKQASEKGRTKHSREPYRQFTDIQKAQIAKYAVKHRNQAAIHRYSKEFCTEIKESTFSTWKSKYKKKINNLHKERRYGESGEIIVSDLTSMKRERPLLLGEELDRQVQSYVRATRDGKGAVTTAVVLAAGEAIVRHSKKNLPMKTEDPLNLLDIGLNQCLSG